MTSAWNGTSWSTPERIGDLADSSGASWPNVSEYEGRIWATYNRKLKVAPFNHNVFALHSLGDPTSAEQASLDVQRTARGVLLQWSVSSISDPVGVRLYRSAATDDGTGQEPPIGSIRIHETGSLEGRAGTFLDTRAEPGGYDYWLEILLSPGSSIFIGPRQVHIDQSSPTPPRILSAIPNPASGSIVISGVAGSEGVRLEVFNVQGRRVRLIEIKNRDGASFEIGWNGRTDAGHPVSSGVYFIRIQAQGMTTSEPKRILFLR